MSVSAVLPVDDAALVTRACAGDERAFSALYRRHVRYVAGVLYRLLRRDAELDDVLQQTFADAYVGVRSLRDRTDFRAWVARIAVRRASDCLASRRRRHLLARAVQPMMPRVSDPEARRDIENLYQVLDRLTPRLRVPWVLSAIQGETTEQVARLCSISLSTAKRRIARAAELIERRLHAG
ncbi:MAG: RNA polymerase sigma factor [Polyangiaceae bacterium]|nr:RNA polymerase sigma factor [Polyangiaceae bacterium]